MKGIIIPVALLLMVGCSSTRPNGIMRDAPGDAFRVWFRQKLWAAGGEEDVFSEVSRKQTPMVEIVDRVIEPCFDDPFPDYDAEPVISAACASASISANTCGA